jgi:hypothetical protein
VPPVAVTLILGVVQVTTVVPELLVIPAVGGVLFNVVVIDDVAVHPFAPVTVTVNVPAVVILAAAALPKPPLHA